MNKKELTKIYRDYNLTDKDVYTDKTRGFTIVSRSGIEKIQFHKNIKVKFDVISKELDNIIIKAKSYTKDNNGNWEEKMETFGSANNKNCIQNFKVEIAEKRALARVIIKTIFLVNTYGEDELKK
tara:strand:- start:42 stop:416 length:375 start_codon:yes stop_codon:yes gene_type:complete